MVLKNSLGGGVTCRKGSWRGEQSDKINMKVAKPLDNPVVHKYGTDSFAPKGKEQKWKLNSNKRGKAAREGWFLKINC